MTRATPVASYPKTGGYDPSVERKEGLTLNLELRLTGKASSREALQSLQDWIRDERIPGAVIERRIEAPVPGEMGVDVTALSVVLSAPAVVTLIESIQVWIEKRSPKVTLSIKAKDREVHLDAQNLKNAEAVVDQLLAAFEE